MNYELEVEHLLKNTHEIHLVAGLAAEVGEVCGVFQKASYKEQPIDLMHLKEELGDVLFYATALANKYGWDLSNVMEENIKKLKRRYK